MKIQLDPVILDLSKSVMPQETCESRQSLSSRNMGLLVLLVLALFLIPNQLVVWPTIIFQLLFIIDSPPVIQKIMNKSKK